MSHTSLHEQVRPLVWSDVVGQEQAVKMLQRVGAGGKAFWFAGPSGTGKTTLARILSATIADDWAIEEVDAQDVGIDYVRRMEKEFTYRCMGKGGRAYIVNEAHGLRGAVLSRMLTLLEPIPSHVCVCFTTTSRGERKLFAEMDDASPFISRCLIVPMAWHQYAADVPGPLTYAVAKRAMEVAQSQSLDGKPLAAYVALALKCNHNLRQMLSSIHAGVMLD